MVAGRVLDAGTGGPVAAAAVRVTAEDTHLSTSTTSAADGRYSLAVPRGAGPFSLRAERIGYVALTVTLELEPGAGSTLRDLRLTPRGVPLAPVVATERRPERQSAPPHSPGGNEATTLSWSAGTVPIDLGDLAGQAGLQPGVRSTDGGVSFFGQDPSQTRVTLDGAPFGALQVPAEALAAVSVASSTYDVSVGQFSGGLIAATTLGGTNLFGAALRARVSDPRLQWRTSPETPRSAEAALGTVEGGMGGALVWNRLFWYAAFTAADRSAPLAGLESAGDGPLRARGLHPAAAGELRSSLAELGVGGSAVVPTSARSNSGSGLLRLDYDFSQRHSLMLRLDGRRGSIGGLGVDPLATLGSAVTLREGAAGVLAQLTSYSERLTNELRVYRADDDRRLSPQGIGPAGVVRVAPEDGDGAPGESAAVRIGASAQSSRSSRSRIELGNALRVDAGAGHEVRAGVLLSQEAAEARDETNRQGTFVFSSIADLRAGRAALYTRALGDGIGETRARYAALWLGDSWKRGPFSLTYGLRWERQWYPSANSGLEPVLGLRPGWIPSDAGISARAGWEYAPRKGWSLHGGVGRFQGTFPVAVLAGATFGTGVGGPLQLACVGPAAPVPDWRTYAGGGAAPETCAAGQPALSTLTPEVTVFAPGFVAPRTLHASLGGATDAVPGFRLMFESSLTLGRGQPLARDRNLGAPQLSLAHEAGRPFFSQISGVDPATGEVALGGSRMDPAWGVVREIGAAGRSANAQATLSVFFPYSPTRPVSVRVPWIDVSYTFTRARDDAGALATPIGSAPLAVPVGERSWAASDAERQHELLAYVSYSPLWWLRMGVVGRALSGAPFTPLVDGDVNGDGQRNDPAFVFGPAATGDSAVGNALSRLVAGAPARIRECLSRQTGRVAGRNSCRTPWTASLDLRLELRPIRPPAQQRLRVSLTTQNTLGLVDRVVNGRSELRGWGDEAIPDATLLRVAGFDPDARAFTYRVNPAFGSSRTLGRPFALIVEGRVTVGSDPAYQPLQRLLGQTLQHPRTAEELRREIARRIPNLPAQVLGLDSALALSLNADARTRLQMRAAAQGATFAPLADSMAVLVSDLENGRRKSSRAAWGEVDALARRIAQHLSAELEEIRALLTPAQWSRLPPEIRAPDAQFVPPRPIRGS